MNGPEVAAALREIGYSDTITAELSPYAKAPLQMVYDTARHLGRDFRVTIDGVNLSIAEKDQTATYTSTMDFYNEQDNAFVEAVLNKRPELILSPYADAMKTLEVTLAASESARTGNPIEL